MSRARTGASMAVPRWDSSRHERRALISCAPSIGVAICFNLIQATAQGLDGISDSEQLEALVDRAEELNEKEYAAAMKRLKE